MSSDASRLDTFLATQATFRQPERLQFLYSDFSYRRQSNPQGFDGAVTWWKQFLTALAIAGLQREDETAADNDHLVLRLDTELLDRLKRPGIGRPAALGSVMTELAKSKAFLPMQAFIASPHSIYNSSWPGWLARNLVGKPLWWALKAVSIVGDDQAPSSDAEWKHNQGEWIILSSLEQAGKRVAQEVDKTANLSDRLFSHATFRSRFSKIAIPGVDLTENDMKVLLRFLERDSKVLVNSHEAIKILGPSKNEVSAVTDNDHNVLNVNLTIAKLQRQVDDLARQVEYYAAKATTHVKNGQTDLARSAIKNKRVLLATVKERSDSLDNLLVIRLRIDNAANDAAILTAYESAASALKTLTPQADQVDKVVDGLANAMADAKEIEDILKNAGDDLAIVAGAELRLDDDELEKELEALAREKEAEAKNGVKEKPKEEEKPDRPAQEEENEPRREEEQSQREREAELA